MLLELRHSRVATQLIIAAHLLSISVLWLAQLPVPLKIALLASVLLSAIRFRRTANTRPRLTLMPNREIILAQYDIEQAGTLLPSTLITPFLVLLRFRIANSISTIPVFYDALPYEQFRALRVQLKLNP